MAQHRPISERIAEAQRQILTLQAKENKQAINADPGVKLVDTAIAELNRTNAKWKRWSKDAEDKVENFMARADEWRTRGAEADTAMEAYHTDLDALKVKRQDAIEAATKSLLG